jgi:hypothetical protein
MSYLLTSQSSLQTLSSDQSLQTIFKASTSALEVDSTVTYTVSVSGGQPSIISLPNMTSIQAIAIKSILPFDVSMRAVAGVDVYTGCPSTTFIKISALGFLFDHLKITSTAATTVELTVGGLF